MLWTVQSFASFDLSLTNTFFLQINDGNRNVKATNAFIIQNATPNATNTCPLNNTTTSLSETGLLLPDRKARLVGIGLGVGLGVPLLLALASIVFLLTSSRRVERAGSPDTKLGVNTTVEEPREDFYYYHEASGQNEVYEASNRDTVHEAPEGNAVPFWQG